VGDRTLDLPTCSAVPQPTASPPAPVFNNRCQYWMEKCVVWGAELFVRNTPAFIQGNSGKLRIISVGFGWLWTRVWILDPPPTICCYSFHSHFRKSLLIHRDSRCYWKLYDKFYDKLYDKLPPCCQHHALRYYHRPPADLVPTDSWAGPTSK